MPGFFYYVHVEGDDLDVHTWNDAKHSEGEGRELHRAVGCCAGSRVDVGGAGMRIDNHCGTVLHATAARRSNCRGPVRCFPCLLRLPECHRQRKRPQHPLRPKSKFYYEDRGWLGSL